MGCKDNKFLSLPENKASLAKIVTPYTNPEGKKSQVSKMFNNIARTYDFLNHFLSLGIDRTWRRKTIRELAPLRPRRILDVATGTADLALEARKQLAPNQIIGVDIAAKMLDIGRGKIHKKGWDQYITLQLGDSENLEFEANSFDAVTVAFGVRNFEHLRAGLAEMYRVTRPGGMIAVLEFSQPRIFPFRQIYQAYFKYLLPLVGRLTSKDPKAYRYLFESVQAFPDGEAFGRELEQVGWTAVQIQPLTLGICTLYTAQKKQA